MFDHYVVLKFLWQSLPALLQLSVPGILLAIVIFVTPERLEAMIIAAVRKVLVRNQRR